MHTILLIALILGNAKALAVNSACPQNNNHTYSCKTAPKTMLDCMTDDLLGDRQKLKKKALKEETFNKEVNDIISKDILPSLDLEYMASHVIGRCNWKNSTEQEKKRFRNLFQTIVTQEYSYFIRKVDNQNLIKLYPPRKVNKKSTAVYGLLQDGNKSITVGFYLSWKDQNSDNAWKIYDLTLDNISYLDQYRLQFAAIIRNSGLKGLTDKLEEMAKK